MNTHSNGKILPTCLLGALAGDMIGSVYEFNPYKGTDFPLFGEGSRLTDDSILTLAVADSLISGGSYLERIRAYALAYPKSGFGGMFREWMHDPDPRPYGSFGNGSAMRVSPVGWAFETVDEVLNQAKASAVVTHNHPEGVKGAQAVALAIFLARKGTDKEHLRAEISSRFGYDLSARLDEIRPGYGFDETCQKTVPPAMIAFLESENFEEAVRLAVSLGGDADTLAAISGSIAEAYYGGVPEEIVNQVRQRTLPVLWGVVAAFGKKFRK